MPETLLYIGRCAFSNCLNLRELTLPERLRYIGDHAFWHCGHLTELSIPESVVMLGEEALPQLPEPDADGFVCRDRILLR